ncbi:hypothetical protein BPAE_0008g00800 [Botrytis paeoniae]|uniref:2EXR domain-containing protein n=1 Tax=Botrytis paeoniae TaxID=278948 RepID=A0A4Z1G2W2_9HELO|nr:hypothetical protein BPAE_0008g00800 [Botrytis paeoniae]
MTKTMAGGDLIVCNLRVPRAEPIFNPVFPSSSSNNSIMSPKILPMSIDIRLPITRHIQESIRYHSNNPEIMSSTYIPTEIRLQIWRTIVDRDLSPPRAIIGDTLWEPRTIGALQVNHESRTEALLHRLDLEIFEGHSFNARGSLDLLRPNRFWFSMEADVFVTEPIHDFILGIWDISDLNWAVQTIAIPQSKSGLGDIDLCYDQHLSDLIVASKFTSVKTLVILRDDPAQEVIPYLDIINPAIRSASDDIRVSIDPIPLSQEEKEAFGFGVQWYNTFVPLIRQKMGPNRQVPAMKWGCLVRR